MDAAQYVDLRGDLNVDLLREASAAAAREIGSGFRRIIEVGAEPYQAVDLSLEAPLAYIALRSADDPEHAAQAWMRDEYSKPVNLVKDSLGAAAVLRLAGDRYYWFARVHHG